MKVICAELGQVTLVAYASLQWDASYDYKRVDLIVADLSDHIEAASIQTTCRRNGIQIETIDALLAQLAIGHDLEFLTADRDFTLIGRHFPLRTLTET